MNIRVAFFGFFLMCFASKVHAQKISYEETNRNFQYAGYDVIGEVKNHLVVWFYNNASSTISVYDNDLKPLNKTKTKIINDVFAVNFINENDSFAVIYQYASKDSFYCKSAVFDANGNNTSLQTLKSEKINLNQTSRFNVIQSPDKKIFLLLRYFLTQERKLLIEYMFFDHNKISFRKVIHLPVSQEYAGCQFFLDDNYHLLALPNKFKADNSCLLFEINPGTGDYTYMQHTVENGSLSTPTLNISFANDMCFITATVLSDTPGLFVWQPDLKFFSKGIDTTYTLNDSAFKLAKNEVLKTEVFTFKNTYTLLSAVQRLSIDSSTWEQSGGSYYSGSSYTSQSFYTDRLSSALPNLPGTTVGYDYRYSYQSNSYNNGYWNKTAPISVKNPFVMLVPKDRISVVNIDDKLSIQWRQYFSSDIENKYYSHFNSIALFNRTDFKICYGKTDVRNTNLVSFINFSNNGSYSIDPVVLVKTDYHWSLFSPLRINGNTIIFPCDVRGKLGFIKLETK